MRLDYRKIREEQPLAVKKLYKDIGLTSVTKKLYDFFDKNKVRVYTRYGASGGYSVEVYRAKTRKEFEKSNPNTDSDMNWRMTRIGIIQSYNTRDDAEKKGFEEAFAQLEFLIKENVIK